MSKKETFGGVWTIEKLDILSKYLDFYTTALKNQNFRKIYVDGFAGEGEITLRNGQKIEGSASIALNIGLPFDRYYFIELNTKKAKKLELLKSSRKDRNITIINSDANIALQSLVLNTDWRYSRGVFFVDPFATQTEWKTLKVISDTGSIDLWFLFPFYAVNRLFAKDKEQIVLWKDRLNNCFGGNDWEDAIYKKKEAVQLSIFEGEQFESDFEKVGTDSIIKYVTNKLKTIFPYVAPNPRIFKNEKNSIMFILFFMTSSKNPKAQVLASKCAEHILKTKE